MKNNFLLYIFFACIICFTACNMLNPGKQKLEFYYYPSKNVYYDVANAQFIYSLNGGETWSFFKKKIVRDPATLGNRQIIYSDSPQPWDSNNVHRKTYNGNLLAIANADSGSVQPDVIQEKKITKKTKAVAQPKTQTEPEKKQGFFKRLFKKKHNNNK